MATSRKKQAKPKPKQREAREARAARVKIVGAHDLVVVRLRAYTIVDNAVLDGVARGVARAFKHTESPDAESIKEQ